MWTELFLLGMTLTTLLSAFVAVIYRLERDFWRSEAESLQNEVIRWEKRAAEHEGIRDGNA